MNAEPTAVNDRDELLHLLTEAAQFEHTVICTYLYAQWSLKKDLDEGITAATPFGTGQHTATTDFGSR